MEIRRGFNRNFGTWFVNRVLGAVRKYGLIEAGDRICAALSGGKDSSTLLFILDYLRRYSPLRFDLIAAHVKTGEYDTSTLQRFCAELEIPYVETALERLPDRRVRNHCYVCARLKRGALLRVAADTGIRKIAFGHHATDVAETFFMNLVGHGTLGSFCPRVEIGSDRPMIIRPLVYLDEAEICRVHRYVRLPLLEWTCPWAAENSRTGFKELLNGFERQTGITHLAGRVVRALEHVDTSNFWSAVEAPATRDSGEEQ